MVFSLQRFRNAKFDNFFSEERSKFAESIYFSNDTLHVEVFLLIKLLRLLKCKFSIQKLRFADYPNRLLKCQYFVNIVVHFIRTKSSLILNCSFKDFPLKLFIYNNIQRQKLKYDLNYKVTRKDYQRFLPSYFNGLLPHITHSSNFCHPLPFSVFDVLSVKMSCFLYTYYYK